MYQTLMELTSTGNVIQIEDFTNGTNIHHGSLYFNTISTFMPSIVKPPLTLTTNEQKVVKILIKAQLTGNIEPEVDQFQHTDYNDLIVYIIN